jgi:hypothetical protein
MSLIETVTVGSGGAASIEFTSIPQDGTDLVLLLSGGASGINQQVNLTINGDTGSNYLYVYLRGSSGSVSSAAPTGFSFFPMLVNSNSQTANTFGNSMAYFSNYAISGSKNVSFDHLNENNATATIMQIQASSWTGSAAITSLRLSLSNLVEHSTASLYKITKGSIPGVVVS